MGRMHPGVEPAALACTQYEVLSTQYVAGRRSGTLNPEP